MIDKIVDSYNFIFNSGFTYNLLFPVVFILGFYFIYTIFSYYLCKYEDNEGLCKLYIKHWVIISIALSLFIIIVLTDYFS